MTNKLTPEETERLLAASDREILIHALAENIKKGEVSKIAVESLNEILKAWAMKNSRGSFIRSMFRVTSPTRIITGSSPSVFDVPHTPVYDDTYLEWFDSLIIELKPIDKAIVNKEAFHRKDRKRADRWAKVWNRHPSSYYRRLKAIREKLIKQIIDKAERGW